MEKKNSIYWRRYLTYNELTNALRDLCAEHPDKTELFTIGRSLQGRELWTIEVTNKITGPAKEKPALWIDGNTHSSEVTGSAVCIRTLSYLLDRYGKDEAVTEILDNKVIYILPRVNPDGADVFLTQPYHNTAAGIPNPAFLDGEGHYEEDINGDGKITFIRIPDENGDWKISGKDPRLMLKRQAEDQKGPFYRVLREGKFLKYKPGKAVTMASPRFLGGTNRNYPAYWEPGGLPLGGSGAFPLQEVEPRAIADFWASHPNLSGMHTFHTNAGLILRESTVHPDSWFIDQDLKQDLEIYKYIAKIGEEATGYPCLSVFEEFTFEDDRPFRRGCSLSFFYEHLGAFNYSIELWELEYHLGFGHFRERGGVDFNYTKLSENDQLKELQWIDKYYPEGFVNWHAINHPQLGYVEVGGINTKYTRRNPPPGDWLEKECDKALPFALRHAALLPLIRITDAKVTKVADDIYKVEAKIVNTGWLPTNVTEIAIKIKKAPPVIAEIILPNGAQLVIGQEKVNLGHLEGRSAKILAPRVVGGEVIDKTRASVEWVVKTEKSMEIIVEARCARAGTHRKKMELTDII
ncbi:MAG: M14 family metallopeptidase [Candidatus Bathyarchaeota archaeon]|nr:M14 family metallopeptidase [Candidatus Bathyarchaeota archaeon]